MKEQMERNEGTTSFTQGTVGVLGMQHDAEALFLVVCKPSTANILFICAGIV